MKSLLRRHGAPSARYVYRVGRVALSAFACVVGLLAAAPAAAHEGGKAEPRIAAAVRTEGGLVRMLTVRVTDVDSGDRVRAARVVASAEMTRPHVMSTAPVRLDEAAAGVYRARLEFLMGGRWTVVIGVGGNNVVPATARLPVDVEWSTQAAPGSAGGPPVKVLSTRIEAEVSDRDVANMAVLWLHSLSALAWIVGMLVMTAALSTRPGVLAETARTRLAGWYQRRGAWLHWSLVPVIVGTGIYNMLYVTPFPLAYTPSELERLADIPYGPLYETILILKLGLFGVLLITGTLMLFRTLDQPLPAVAVGNPHPGFVRTLASVLGPEGVAYLATVPLIIAAAMALRYVHILSHVAQVLRTE